MNKLNFIFFLFLLTGAPFCQRSVAASANPELSQDNEIHHEIKILVLIIASDQLPIWQEDQNAWKAYMHLDENHVETYFLKSNPNLQTSCEIQKDVVWILGEESFIPGILNKTILAMEFFLPHIYEYDYILRTNLSSFYVFPRLLKFMESLPKTKCYCGVDNPEGPSISGAGIIFSPDVVEILVQNKGQLLNHSIIDDVAIGMFLNKSKIPRSFAPRKDILSIEDWFNQKGAISEDAFHFRTKNHQNYEEQIFVQKQLCKLFYGLEF